MTTYTEYEFTLPDGTKRYEIATCLADVMSFKSMHKAMSAMPVKETATQYTVCLNAWTIEDNGDQVYCDPADQEPDGWNTYVRVETPKDPQQPFDVPDEYDTDFKTRDEAHRQAAIWAAEFNTEIREF